MKKPYKKYWFLYENEYKMLAIVFTQISYKNLGIIGESLTPDYNLLGKSSYRSNIQQKLDIYSNNLKDKINTMSLINRNTTQGDDTAKFTNRGGNLNSLREAEKLNFGAKMFDDSKKVTKE